LAPEWPRAPRLGHGASARGRSSARLAVKFRREKIVGAKAAQIAERRRGFGPMVRRALVTVLDRAENFRIVHISVQGNHIHLLCEANDKVALGKGMQAFAISAAKHLNRVHAHKGTVFPDHYHVEAIDSVRQTCHELSYVLNNWRKHKQDGRGLYVGKVDPFSSGLLFEGWKERTQPVSIPEGYEAPRVSAAQTWYLTKGYKLGPPISVWAVPSLNRRTAA
jgi:REP element-mobilizing transposase RayT